MESGSGKQKRIEEKTPPIDWAAVAKGVNASNRKINQSGEISAKDHVWLVVAGKLLGKSAAAMLQTAVYTYLRRNFGEHLALLDFVASREGISREDAIKRIYDGDLSP